MSQQRCPACGRALKTRANFCSYCGARLTPPNAPSTPIQSEAAAKSEVIPSSEVRTPDLAVEPMPPAVEAAVILRGKFVKLGAKKEALDEELETVRVKQLIGELSKAAAQKRIGKLEDQIAPIDKELKDIESKAQSPIDQLEHDHKTHEERLQRLETLKQSGEVDETIYQRLLTEYRRKLEDIEQQLNTERNKAQQWLHHFTTQQQQLEFEKETLQVRAKIDDISKSKVNQTLKTIEQKLTKITNILEGLHAILGKSTANTPSTTKDSIGQGPPANCPFCKAKIPPNSKFCYTCGRIIIR